LAPGLCPGEGNFQSGQQPDPLENVMSRKSRRRSAGTTRKAVRGAKTRRQPNVHAAGEHARHPAPERGFNADGPGSFESAPAIDAVCLPSQGLVSDLLAGIGGGGVIDLSTGRAVAWLGEHHGDTLLDTGILYVAIAAGGDVLDALLSEPVDEISLGRLKKQNQKRRRLYNLCIGGDATEVAIAHSLADPPELDESTDVATIARLIHELYEMEPGDFVVQAVVFLYADGSLAGCKLTGVAAGPPEGLS
jgi:hypothetical protein